MGLLPAGATDWLAIRPTSAEAPREFPSFGGAGWATLWAAVDESVCANYAEDPPLDDQICGTGRKEMSIEAVDIGSFFARALPALLIMPWARAGPAYKLDHVLNWVPPTN